MSLVYNLQNAIEVNSSNNAFHINNVYYSYKDLAQHISNIRHALRKIVSESDLYIGLVCNDDIEAYASIFAVWMEGKAYVPLNPDFPIERNETIIEEAGIDVILDSSEKKVFEKHQSILTKKIDTKGIDLTHSQEYDSSRIAYILFTSGTTGKPKGVPISIDNLIFFVDAFKAIGYSLTSADRCLQMFELTFDMSVMSYLLPILNGACVYTIPKDKIKYSYIFELMEDHELTFAAMVPSILHYLRPYFDEIDCPKMRFCLFAGEALPLDVTEEWVKCVPNAKIINAYGPTETTIICTSYEFEKDKSAESHNGILSLGKLMPHTEAVVINEDESIVAKGEKGELCLSGKQLTPGYWKNEEKNQEAFFVKNIDGVDIRFYKTGDLCFENEEGNLFYLGRKDFQAKIQGYRVELSEIEFHSKAFFDKLNVVAMAVSNHSENAEIGLVIESEAIETASLVEFLKTKLPHYMIPTQFKFTNPFPLNVNGKIDRKSLKTLF